MIQAYIGAVPRGERPQLAELTDAVNCAQISLAVQWLGWFGRRRAPAVHTRNWLAEATQRAEMLRL